MAKLLIILLFSSILYAKNDSFNFFYSRWKISKSTFKALKKEYVIVQSNVDTNKEKIQSFEMKAMGYHPKKCKKVLKKLSFFENYPNMIDFIKTAKYQKQSKLLTVTANHTLLPFPMIVYIIIDRPTKEGIYPFRFPTGIFDGLKGTFEIKEVAKRCSVFAKSTWSGKDTKIPDLVIEIFSETLTKIAVRTLIRKTSL